MEPELTYQGNTNGGVCTKERPQKQGAGGSPTRLAFLTRTGQGQTQPPKLGKTQSNSDPDNERRDKPQVTRVTFVDQLVSRNMSCSSKSSAFDNGISSSRSLPQLMDRNTKSHERPGTGASGTSVQEAVSKRVRPHTGNGDSYRTKLSSFLRNACGKPGTDQTLHSARSSSRVSREVEDLACRRSRGKSAKLLHRRSRSAPRLLHRRDRRVNTHDQEESAVLREESRQKARHRFRRAVRMVTTFLKWFRVITESSATLTARTAVEMQWHTLNTSSEARKLAFNPANFAKNRVHTAVPVWARHILVLPVDMRSEADCWKLHALLRGLRSFDKFTEKIQLAMCRACSYHFVDAGRVVLRKGHVGFNFYFLYSGSVFVNVEDVNSQGEIFTKTEVVLIKGDSFGELALLNDDRRAATVACREDCELLVVDKEVFAHVCPKIFDKELQEKVSFLSQMTLFHSKYWGPKALNNICFEAQIQEYKTGKVVVVDDSAEEDWVHVCMQGRCRITKCLPLGNVPSKEETDEHPLLAEENMLTAEFLDSVKSRGRRLSVNSRRLSITDNEIAVKKKLLDSMCLAYSTPDKNEERPGNDVRDMEQQKSMMEKAEDTSVEDQKQRVHQNTLTLRTLMGLRAQQDVQHRDFVYLDIGTLNPQEVFNLAEILQPRSRSSGSCLILVSSGARMLKIKKAHFTKWMSEEALEHAKHIAMRSLYPTDAVLLRSYREQACWDKYKRTVVKEAMMPYLNQVRRSPLNNYIDERQKSMKSQETRLLSALKKNRSQEKLNQNDTENGNNVKALDPAAMPDVHESFESRMLREGDGNGGTSALAQTRMIPYNRQRSLYRLSEINSKHIKA